MVQKAFTMFCIKDNSICVQYCTQIQNKKKKSLSTSLVLLAAVLLPFSGLTRCVVKGR